MLRVVVKEGFYCIIKLLLFVYSFIGCKFVFGYQKIHPCLGEYLINVLF